MRKTKGKVCVICNKASTLIKVGHVCLTCFRKATEAKVIQISEKGAEKLGQAYAVANFVQWGIQKLIEVSCGKLPVLPAGNPDSQARETKERLNDLAKRLNRNKP